MMTLQPPLTDEIVRSLNAGDEVQITGIIYTARDMAHKRICEAIQAHQNLPFNLEGEIIYFVGPTPSPPGKVIGSAGPTTSSRMDPFSPILYEQGLKATVGKGYRNSKVVESLRKYNAVHMSAIGGAGALLSKYIKASRIIAYEDLAAEAVRQLEVVDFPAVVAYDTQGNSVYK